MRYVAVSSIAAAPRGPLATWQAAIRVPTLPAAAAPVVAASGLAIADHQFEALPAFAALFGALCLQVGANLANDAFDHQRGADTPGRLGPPRAVASGWLTAASVFRGMWLSFGLATVAGVYLVAVAGWPVVLIGVAAILCAMAYTGGPWALGYHGLGDAATFLFFGPAAVIGAYFVQAGEVTAASVWTSVAVGCVITALLVVNNIRDLETDRAAGKRTFAVFIGPAASRVWYTALVAAAAGIAVAVTVTAYEARWAWVLALPLPLAFRLVQSVLGGLSGRALNPVLKRTAQLSLLLSVAFALAVSLSRLG